jgi:hypothetical protein
MYDGGTVTHRPRERNATLHGLDCQVEATDLPIESLGRGVVWYC